MPRLEDRSRRLAGKVAIVTGAGSAADEIGIGRAICLLLAAERAKVACLDLDIARAQRTAEMIRAEGGDAIAVQADVAKPNDCVQGVASVAQAFGGVDILVNNVGISPPMRLDLADLSIWDRTIAVNLTGAMQMCASAVPAMRARGGGSIVNISSLAGVRAHGAIAYGTAKAAMQQLAREITVLHGPDGIRANAVAPGHVMTPHAANAPGQLDLREERRRISPLGIEGDAWDIAMAVCFLASDEARFITGAILPVDAGVTEIGPLVAHMRMRAGMSTDS